MAASRAPTFADCFPKGTSPSVSLSTTPLKGDVVDFSTPVDQPPIIFKSETDVARVGTRVG